MLTVLAFEIELKWIEVLGIQIHCLLIQGQYCHEAMLIRAHRIGLYKRWAGISICFE